MEELYVEAFPLRAMNVADPADYDRWRNGRCILIFIMILFIGIPVEMAVVVAGQRHSFPPVPNLPLDICPSGLMGPMGPFSASSFLQSST